MYLNVATAYAGFVRVRYVDHRTLNTSRSPCHFIVALTLDGDLLIWNALTTLLIWSTALLEAGETAMDFMLVDFVLEKEFKIGGNCKVVLLFKDGNGACQVSSNLSV